MSCTVNCSDTIYLKMELYRETLNYFAGINENLVVHLHVKINRYLLFIGKEFINMSCITCTWYILMQF